MSRGPIWGFSNKIFFMLFYLSPRLHDNKCNVLAAYHTKFRQFK